MSISSCTHTDHPPGFCPKRQPENDRYYKPVSQALSSSSQVLPPPGFPGVVTPVISYPKQSTKKSPEELAEMLLQTQGKSHLNQNESRKICNQIANPRIGLDQIVSLVQNVNITDSHHILNAIFSKKFPNNSDEKYIQQFQKALFERMPKHLLDVSVLNQQMKLAGSRRNFDLVDKLFNEVQKRGAADSYTYSIYLQYGNCRPEKALEVFDEANEKGLANIYVLNNCLNILKDFPEYYPEIDCIFHRAMNYRKDVQPQTCCIFLQAVGKTNLFDEADEAFEFAKERGLVNDYVIAEYIKICSKHQQWEKASEALSLMTTIETIPYTNYMLMAAKCGQLDEAKKTFAILKRSGKANAFTHVKFLEILGEKGTFAEVEQFFKETQENRKYLSNEFIQIYGRLFQRNRKSEDDQKIIDQLPQGFMSLSLSVRAEKEEGITNPEDTYASWCTANLLGHANAELDQHSIYFLGKLGRLDLAKQVFDDAKANGRANEETCSCYLFTLKSHEAWELADEAFDWLMTLPELPQNKSLSIYADILGIQKRREDLEKLHHIAASSNPEQPGQFFQVYIQQICNMGNQKKAEELIAAMPAPILTSHFGSPQLDLHGYSRWGGYLELLRLMREESCPSSFHVIPGQGGDEWGNYLVFKNFILEQFKASPLAAIWSLEAHPNNPGVLICEKRHSYKSMS